MTNYTTLSKVFRAFVDTMQAIAPGGDPARIGNVTTNEVKRKYRFSVSLRYDRGVHQDGHSRRTASFLVKVIAVDDESQKADANDSQLTRLIELFEPVYYGILQKSRSKEHGFVDMPVNVIDDPEAAGITAEGYDLSQDRRAWCGAYFRATYNRQFTATPN